MEASQALKQATFVVETNASSRRIGAVLKQEKHSIAFIGKSLPPRLKLLSIFEKKLLAIVFISHIVVIIWEMLGYCQDRTKQEKNTCIRLIGNMMCNSTNKSIFLL